MVFRRTLSAVAAAALVATGCGTADVGPGSDGRPLVVASFYPLAFAAESVAGEHAQIADLTPSGVEPHDLELSPGQVRLLHGADLVLYLGAGFQPAVEDLVGELDTRAVDVLDESEGADPHVWLDPRRMQIVARVVGEELAAIDPGNAAVYRRNAQTTVRALADLDAEMLRGLEDCRTRDLVVSHEAFGYLAARYDLNQHGIAGLDPEAEPSPQRLAEAIRFARDNQVETIFFESLVDPAVAETVAREIGAGTAVLDPLESAPRRGDYLDAMRANLAALRSGLDCR